MAAILLGFASSARAQSEYTRVELGGEFSTVQERGTSNSITVFAGFGGRFDWNFTRRLAFESQVDFFPQHGMVLPYRQGGQTLEGVFGIRAKVIQTKHLSVFGLVRPGFLHFSEVEKATGAVNPVYRTAPATYFTLNLGGGIEYCFSERWAARLDISGNPYVVGNDRPTQNFFVAGSTQDTTRISLGLAYRPGALREHEAERKITGNWEFGPLYSNLTLMRDNPQIGVRNESGFGAYASLHLYKVFFLDGDLLYFPQYASSPGIHDGGTILQGLFGVKGGIRRNHMGFFGKVRPGFNYYSKSETGYTLDANQTPVFSYSPTSAFVLDLGGIVEFYPTERGTLRIEAGDTHIFWSDKSYNANGTPVSYPGGKLRHSIQLAFGYGWRF